jgi:hypothetical protein
VRSRPALRTLFWIELVLAVLCAALAILTLFWHGWIEATTGFDPDHGDGSAEWLIVAGLFAASGLASFAAGTEWRRSDPYAGYVDL